MKCGKRNISQQINKTPITLEHLIILEIGIRKQSDILKAKPYGEDFVVNKKECVRHVQKRMGTRFCDLVKKTVEEKQVKAEKKSASKTTLLYEPGIDDFQLILS
ncbi:hypothetical protein KM043_007740 [Ampulex compressa]|nr:hypothetical protein KM043_007740 [Ampulex compressa]